MKVDRFDIVVGIPSLNEVDNIAFVVRQVALGLRRHFPGWSSLIVNVDNASTDGTREAFLSADTGGIPRRYISTEKGVCGKGNNMLNLFREIERVQARVGVVVDADLRSIRPEWIERLVLPVLEGYDYVTPLYSRNEYDGTITNHITYPVLYGLLRADIRQPIGGEFAFSPRLVRFWLKLPVSEETRQYGIDIFMTTTALFNGFRVCQVALGTKIHKPSAPKLGPMFTQVVNSFFTNILRFREVWMEGKTARTPLFGEHTFEEPQGLSIDYKSMKKRSLEGFREMEDLISSILPPQIYHSLRDMYGMRRWSIGPKLWAKIVYDFIYAYYRSGNSRDVVEALKPLYFARSLSFYRQTIEMDHCQAEQRLRNQAREFCRLRGYLIERFYHQEVAV